MASCSLTQRSDTVVFSRKYHANTIFSGDPLGKSLNSPSAKPNALSPSSAGDEARP